MAIKLTKKQAQVYDYIKNYVDVHGFSPSYRDICAGLGLSSVSAVAEHVENLVRIGALRKTAGSARSLEVIDFTYPETTALFREKLSSASTDDIDILRKAANILGIDLTEG